MKTPLLHAVLFLTTTTLLHAFFALPGAAQELRVSAAASLADALREINEAHRRQTLTKVRLNLGASNLLARQIEEGAPVDVFLSADEARMDALEKNGLIDPATRQSLLSNSLAVVVPRDSSLVFKTFGDLTQPGIRRIATGDPESVPVGIYAREHLQKLNLWDQVRPRIVSTENVRAALAAVEAGNAEAGIVYKTDAAFSRTVKIGCEVPAGEGPRIVYPAAMVKSAKNRAAAQAYLTFLRSPAARSVFDKYGFVVLANPTQAPQPTQPTQPTPPGAAPRQSDPSTR